MIWILFSFLTRTLDTHQTIADTLSMIATSISSSDTNIEPSLNKNFDILYSNLPKTKEVDYYVESIAGNNRKTSDISTNLTQDVTCFPGQIVYLSIRFYSEENIKNIQVLNGIDGTSDFNLVLKDPNTQFSLFAKSSTYKIQQKNETFIINDSKPRTGYNIELNSKNSQNLCIGKIIFERN